MKIRKGQYYIELAKKYNSNPNNLNPKKAFYYAKKALSIVSGNDIYLEGMCKFLIGQSSLILQKLDVSLTMFISALKIFRLTNNLKYESWVLHFICLNYLQLNEYHKALYFNLESLKIAEKLNETNNLKYRIFVSFSSIYGFLQKNKNSLYFSLRALEFAKKMENKDYLFAAYNNLGMSMIHCTNYNEAIRYFRLGLKITSKIKDVSQSILLNTNLALAMFKLNQTKNAIHYISISIHYANSMNDINGMLLALKVWCEIQFKIGNYSDIVKKLPEILKNTSSSYTKELKFPLYILLSKSLEKLNEPKKALSMHKLALNMLSKNKQTDSESKIKNILTINKIEKVLLKHEYTIQNEFSKKLIKFQESEKKRISSELHDSIGQTLLLVNNKLLLAQKDFNSSKDSMKLKEISDMTINAIDELRSISQDLRPYEIDRYGLTEAIRSSVERFQDSTIIDINSSIDNIDNCIFKENEILFFRIIQECLNNILKHSKATKSKIVLKKHLNQITIMIKDNGIGFNFLKTNTSKSGMGWKGIQEKVNILKGKIEVKTQQNTGTIIKIIIPIKNNEK